MLKRSVASILAAAIVFSGAAYAQTVASAGEAVGHPSASAAATQRKAINYLLAHQGPDGSWLAQPGPGPTALVLEGLLLGARTVRGRGGMPMGVISQGGS